MTSAGRSVDDVTVRVALTGWLCGILWLSDSLSLVVVDSVHGGPGQRFTSTKFMVDPMWARPCGARPLLDEMPICAAYDVRLCIIVVAW
jgi:hypothetical protein